MSHVRLVLTVQPDGRDRVMAGLVTNGVAPERVALVQVNVPGQDEIAELLSAESNTRWASLNPSLRPVLRNLKIADWFVQAVRAGAGIDASQVVNVSGLIDWLWSRPWIGGADDGDARSALLMNLATMESESLSAGVPRAALGHGEQSTLRALEQVGALSRRHERLFFSA